MYDYDYYNMCPYNDEEDEHFSPVKGCLFQVLLFFCLIGIFALLSILSSCGTKKTVEEYKENTKAVVKVDSTANQHTSKEENTYSSLLSVTDSYTTSAIKRTFFSPPDSSGKQYIVCQEELTQSSGTTATQKSNTGSNSKEDSELSVQKQCTEAKETNIDYKKETEIKSETPWWCNVTLLIKQLFLIALLVFIIRYTKGKNIYILRSLRRFLNFFVSNKKQEGEQ